MRIEIMQWDSGQPLAGDYSDRFEKISAFFDYNPSDADCWEARAAWVDRERIHGADRQRLAEALRRFNERAGASTEALRSIELLKDSRTLCVVGGQQASLFTGPLLVIYKAITLIRAAREASEKLGRPVVPVFWIAGEDHDFDEVNHVTVLTADQQLQKIKLQHPTGLRTSVSRTPIAPEQWDEVLAAFERTLMPTEFKESLMEALRSSTEGATSLTDSFARLLSAWFGRDGLVLVDSDDPDLRRLESPMFRRLAEQSGSINEALLRGQDKLRAAGYVPQAEVSGHGANLFVYDEQGERILLYADEGGGYTDRKEERRYSREQLLQWAEEAPERLSNNVLTRPLMQDYLFPVLGTVLGPSEIAYWALTRDAFHTLGMRMPIVLPRLGFTIVEGTIQKNMHKYGLAIDDALYRLEEKQQAWLREQDQLQLDARFAEVKERFRAGYEPLIGAIAAVNPGLQKLGETNLGKIIEQIDFLQHKADDALRSQYEAGLRQFARIGLSLLPDGKPQERVYNPLAYLNKYGDGWMRELVEMPLPLDGKHRICYM